NKLVNPGDTSGDLPFSRGANGLTADIFVEGTLDVRGRWVNDAGRRGADVAGPAFIDGGSISITTTKRNFNNPGNDDASGSIRLASGSLLDASSGGYISPKGVARMAAPSVMAGKGGTISLLLYQGASDWQSPANGSSPIIPANGRPPS